MQIPGVCRSQGKFSYNFVIYCHFGGHFVCILILFFIFLIKANCLQLDSNFIANNFTEKNALETFFHITHFFHL